MTRQLTKSPHSRILHPRRSAITATSTTNLHAPWPINRTSSSTTLSAPLFSPQHTTGSHCLASATTLLLATRFLQIQGHCALHTSPGKTILKGALLHPFLRLANPAPFSSVILWPTGSFILCHSDLSALPSICESETCFFFSHLVAYDSHSEAVQVFSLFSYLLPWSTCSPTQNLAPD